MTSEGADQRDEGCALHAAGALGGEHGHGEDGELLQQVRWVLVACATNSAASVM